MEQSNIIQKVTESLLNKLESLSTAEEKYKVYTDSTQFNIDDKTAKLKLTLLGVEYNYSKKLSSKIQQKEEDKKGNLVEYFVDPPVIIDLKYMITPYCSNKDDEYKLLGKIVKLIKDNGCIKIDEYDWVSNNNKPVKIESMSDMDFNKQMYVFSILKMDYSPSLFYQVTVGINSENKEVFRRVEKRKIDAYVKKPEKVK
jgi:hypothetical protein